MNDRNPKADARRLGSLDSVDGRPALRFERHLPHSVERVWRAVTAPAELERWFAGPVAWTPSLGEVLDGEGEVTELREPEVIAWSVAPTDSGSSCRHSETAACSSSSTSSTTGRCPPRPPRDGTPTSTGSTRTSPAAT